MTTMMQFEPQAHGDDNVINPIRGSGASTPVSTASGQQQQTAATAPAPLKGLAAVEHINRSATAALRSATLTPEQAGTLERALNDARIILGREAEGTQPWLAAEAAVLNNLGCLLRRVHRLAESVQFLQHAVFLEQKAHGKPSVPTLLNLSAACNALGDTQKACDASLACMADYANLPASLRAITLHNLAMCDYHVPQPQVRERVTLLLERAYSEATQAFGTDHVTTETIYRHLAAITGEVSTRNAELAARALKPLALSASAPSLVRNIDDGGGAASASALEHLRNAAAYAAADGPSAADVMDGARFSTNDGGVGGSGGMNEKETRLLQRRLQEDAEAARAEAAAAAEKQARADLERAKAAAAEAEARRLQKQKELETQREAQRRYELRTQYQRGTNSEMGPMSFMRFSQTGMASMTSSAVNNSSNTTNNSGINANNGGHGSSGASVLAADDVLAAAPPAPLSFTHVRQQFRAMSQREEISRRAAFGDAHHQQQQHGEDGGDDDGMSVRRAGAGASTSLSALRRSQQHGSGRHLEDHSVAGSLSMQTHSIFRDTCDKRRQRSEKERLEDEAYMAATAVARTKQRAERQRDERLAALKRRVENRAASLIQRTWRRHQTEVLTHQMLTNKAMRQSEDMRRARRVVRFAKKWLKRAEGRILLCRLRLKFEPEFVFAAVRRVQCAWRCCAARMRRSARALEKQQLVAAVLAYERRFGAALRIQMWFRASKCCVAFANARHDIKAQAAVKIQRVTRRFLRKERGVKAEAVRRRRENAAAVKIQAAWRGWQARVRAVMLRLQQKMNRLKIKDRRSAERVQRVGRGYLARVAFGAFRAEERHRRAVLASQYNADGAAVLREAEAARAAREHEKEHAWKQRVPPMRPRPPTPSRERVRAAEAFHDESRRLYLDSLQQREEEQRVREFSRAAASDYDRMWAAEQLARTRDFNARRRVACAVAVQRWWRLYRRPVLENHRSLYESKSAARKIAFYDEKFRRERLRELNDLARPIREMRLEMEQQLRAERAAAAAEAGGSSGNVRTTGGNAALFQEWHERPRREAETFVSAVELKKTRREAVEERRVQDEMLAQSRKLTSRYG